LLKHWIASWNFFKFFKLFSTLLKSQIVGKT
jgi:hypothetical protein